MTTHKIKTGECFSSLAEKYGFHEADALYSHADNATLKAKRKNPNLLVTNDRVTIPDKTSKKESCADSAKHRFKAKGIHTHLRLLLEDFQGNALGTKAYALEIGNDKFEGKTKSDGLVDHLVLAASTDGTLTVWLGADKKKSIIWPLEIGFLEPHDTNKGVQARLNNLGYTCGKEDGIVGPNTKSAIKVFKKNNGLADDDTLDDTTRNKIKDVYGF